MKQNISRRDFLIIASLTGGAGIIAACKTKEITEVTMTTEVATAVPTGLPATPPIEETIMTPVPQSTSFLEPIYATGFKIDSNFWNSRIKNIIINWIPHCYNKLSDPYLAEGGIDNFIQAALKLAGKPAKSHVGYWFSNAYVFNTVEAMCNALMIDPQGDADIISAQNAMRAKLDEWLPKILNAQEPDGYFQTWTTLGSHPRWSDRLAHEGYVAGYFLEMAAAHYLMTGKTDATMYNAAKRLADCWYDNLGPAPKKTWWDGHQEMEQALTRFARFVNAVEGAGKGDKYAQLAKFLLDSRIGGDEYDQSHTYPINQTEAVGHAVRAVYMYSGMADVAMLTNSPGYLNAVNALWDNLVNKKMYITGGVGSGETSEGFGTEYSLPNAAYSESCANCGMLFFQHKMNMAYQNGKYADLMELVLYNSILGSLDLEAKHFTYTNPLDQDFARYEWHVCPCCVGNIPRTLLSLPTWMYAKSRDTLYVNLFIGSTVIVNNLAGINVQMVQTTDYPWSGNLSITVNPTRSKKFTIKIRVPDRSVSTCYSSLPEANGITSISVNDKVMTPKINKGYAEISRTWKTGDRIDLLLPLSVQRVKANESVLADKDRVALQYGPLVYNIEAVDHSQAKLTQLTLDPDVTLSTQWKDNLLDGVMVIKGVFNDGTNLMAIPNYARNNRGGRSLVWFNDKEKIISAPAEFVAWYKFDETSGNTGLDSTGNGNNSMLISGATWAAGKAGNAVKLDGRHGFVSIPAGILENIGDFTIAAWVKLDSPSTWSRIFDFGTGMGANMFLTPRSIDNTLRFAITTSGANGEQQINSSEPLATGVWKHVAVTLSGNVGILYVDGAEVARNSEITIKPLDMEFTPNNYIGRSQYPDPYLKGQVDDFRIYSRALSSSEINLIYSSN